MALLYVVQCGSWSWEAQLLAYCLAVKTSDSKICPRLAKSHSHSMRLAACASKALTGFLELQRVPESANLSPDQTQAVTTEDSSCYPSCVSCSIKFSVLCERTGEVFLQVPLKKHTTRWGSACQEPFLVPSTKRCESHSTPPYRPAVAQLPGLCIKLGLGWDAVAELFTFVETLCFWNSGDTM